MNHKLLTGLAFGLALVSSALATPPVKKAVAPKAKSACCAAACCAMPCCDAKIAKKLVRAKKSASCCGMPCCAGGACCTAACPMK